VKREALSSEGLLPMTVEVEVSTAGLPEGTPFVGTIEVCLDDQARPVVVTLETAPARGVVPRPVYQTPRPLYTERPRSVKAGLWDGIVKGVSALVVIAVGLGMAALLLVWQVTAPSDQASTRPGASPVAAPPGLKPPTAFVVANTEGRGTFLRGRACDWADRTATLPDGAELKTLGDEAWCEPVAECRDHVWLKVTSPKGEGWIPRCFVKERR
jgi:hypothetical protein